MLRDTLAGAWKRIRGTIRERWGRARGNDLLQHAGRRERLSGQLVLRYGARTGEIRRRVDRYVEHRARQRFTGNTASRGTVGVRGSFRTRSA